MPVVHPAPRNTQIIPPRRHVRTCSGSNTFASTTSVLPRRTKRCPSAESTWLQDSKPSDTQAKVSEKSQPQPSSILKNRASLSVDTSFPKKLGSASMPTSPTFSTRTPAMVRKKSGEIVKSSLKSRASSFGAATPCAPPRSEPSTPTSSKFVHFDSRLNNIKVYIVTQRPTAVSNPGSPVDTETEDEAPPRSSYFDLYKLKIILPSLPLPQLGKDVFLESLKAASDYKSVSGIVRVKNLSFQKWIAVRFTTDSWTTVSEVSAEYKESLDNNEWDRFTFTMKIHISGFEVRTSKNSGVEKRLELAVRYQVNGTEIWDNNDNRNYVILFDYEDMPVDNDDEPPARKQTSGWDQDILDRKLARLSQDRDAVLFKPTSDSTFANRYNFNLSLKKGPQSSPTFSPTKASAIPIPLPSPTTTKKSFFDSKPSSGGSNELISFKTPVYDQPASNSLGLYEFTYSSDSFISPHSKYATYPLQHSSKGRNSLSTPGLFDAIRVPVLDTPPTSISSSPNESPVVAPLPFPTDYWGKLQSPPLSPSNFERPLGSVVSASSESLVSLSGSLTSLESGNGTINSRRSSNASTNSVSSNETISNGKLSINPSLSYFPGSGVDPSAFDSNTMSAFLEKYCFVTSSSRNSSFDDVSEYSTSVTHHRY